MRFKFFGFALLVLSLLVVGNAVHAENISKDESARLQKFFKSRFGTRLPADTEIEVVGFEESAVNGLKTGKFTIKSSSGSQDIDFVITDDGKLLTLGTLVDTADSENFKDTPIEGLKQGAIPMGRGSFPLFISADGKHLIVGGEIVSTDSFKESKLPGMKEGSFVMGGRQQVPIFASNDGEYLLVGSELYDTTIDPHKEAMEKISLEGVPFKGKEDAKVVVVEYSDFQCPFCKRGKDMLPDILKTYDGKIKLAYKQLPLQNHQWAKSAAIASRCAYQQGNDKFWAFHDMVFDSQSEINPDNANEKFKAYAKELGLDTKKFDACLESKDVAARVEAELTEAREVGVSSTPTFVVNGMIVPGANPEALKNAIDLKLSEGSGS